ncbi:MAG: PRC-barrel domain-containing protein [Candidatus Aenigmarchaeota archaeon]|nr:PRC-barrel domain-containing protein [Candidatus Aenigmarchaeota archaeon]
MIETRVRAAEIVGKDIVSEETGRKLGVVENVEFVAESGEMLNIIVTEPTRYLKELGPKVDEEGRILIPFTAVKSIGDFVIVSESELV